MNDDHQTTRFPTVTHWGAYEAEVNEGRVVAMTPVAGDPDPSWLGDAMPGAMDDPVRIHQPMVRQGYLDHGPGANNEGRGGQPFVAVSWDEALDLASAELKRVRGEFGNSAIYAGSYGWSSAGRFHHAQSQLHRFMNCLGGYTSSTDSYSYSAGEVILPHVLGPFQEILLSHTSWDVVGKHGELVVSFGGLPMRNSQVSSGGTGRHVQKEGLLACHDAGVEFVLVGPMRDDMEDELRADWIAARPNTDVALMLGLAHTLVDEGLHDEAFLARYCVGFERFRPYLMGQSDGQPKDADWAAGICNIQADTLRALARRMVAKRTTIALSWSLTRGHHGEQPYWMGTVLAAMLGQIGLPGGGIGFGYSAVNAIGMATEHLSWPSLSQGPNPVDDFIPVARIADMLLNPGDTIDYNGRRVTFPDTRLVYWAGGNPFHHHQDLNRLVKAWRAPDTTICNEIWWNPLARHCDIVLPATTTLERNDFSGSSREGSLFAMHKAVDPVGQGRCDFDIFSGLAERLGATESFTEGRDEAAWLRHLYDRGRQRASEKGVEMPDFDAFWENGRFDLDAPTSAQIFLAGFRGDPEGQPLKTPTGKIEIFSETIDGFGYDDCPGHPVWMEPAEWLGASTAKRFPLHMISSQPAHRLHSQYDNGSVSRSTKVAGREAVWLNPRDAAVRGIAEGDVVRLFNDRGTCLAGARLTEDVMAGVIRLATGAWYDPDTPGEPVTLCRHGNPNVLTRDFGTSKLAQGPSAQTCLVEIEPWQGAVPEVRSFEPPEIVVR
ncbi:MAG: molybdopterin-dependent oxidoreductase [Alphaproteobacteria bacterium]|nr:molybdopterin-dependent oxidoreductase [Alphaproteobacteria bacterium]